MPGIANAGAYPFDLPWFAAPISGEGDTFEISPAAQDSYAIEMRSESLKLLSLGDAFRRGELDRVEIGDAKSTDSVSGSETVTVRGKLREHTEESLVSVASRLETTIDGHMAVTCGKEDNVILGGAMADTWTHGAFIAAVMSDDLIVGAGARVTAPADLWLNTLMGMEERPGTAAADGVLVEMCGTLFEREYGPGIHNAGLVLFTGTVYQTQKTSFMPLMKVSNGVRNLVPGSGAPASESPPPSPPPAPTGGGAEAVGSMVRAGAGTGRIASRADTVADLRHVIEASVEAGNTANDLRRTADTADNLENLRSAARLTGSSPLEDLENIRVAVGQVGDTPYQHLEDLRSSVAQAVGDNGFESLYAGGSLYGTGYGGGGAVADDDLYATVGQHIGRHYGEDLSGRPALPGRYPGRRPIEVLNFVADGRNVVEVSQDTFRRLERGEASLRVVDVYGGVLSPGDYSIAVRNHTVSPLGDLYRTIDLSPHRMGPMDVSPDEIYSRLGDHLRPPPGVDGDEGLYARLMGEGGAPPIPPRTVESGELVPVPPVRLPPDTELPPPLPPFHPMHIEPVPREFRRTGVFKTKPDDFDFLQTFKDIQDKYMDFRRASEWRGTGAYTTAIDDLRAALAKAVTDFGGNTDDLVATPGTVPAADIAYKAIRDMLEQAVESEDLAAQQRIGTFLEEFDQTAYTAYVDLLDRADEFAHRGPGVRKGLDPHIDQQKLGDWLNTRVQDAQRRANEMMQANDFEGVQAASHEMTYYDQLLQALKNGRDPVEESGDEIGYLKGVDGGQHQADIYLGYHDALLEVLSDPSFHRSADEMGDATYAPAYFLRPDLGRVPLDDAPPRVAAPPPGGGAPPVRFQGPEDGIRRLDPDSDIARGILRVEPDAIADAGEDGSGGVRWGGSPGYERVDLDAGPLDQGPAAQPRLGDAGVSWEIESPYRNVEVDPETGRGKLLGDYPKASPSPRVDDGVSTGGDSRRITASDTQAVIDAMPDRRSSDLPDGEIGRSADNPGSGLEEVGDADSTSNVYDAQVGRPNGAPDGDDGFSLRAGDYDANRDRINGQLGEGDFARAPQEQPDGLSGRGSDSFNEDDVTEDTLDGRAAAVERDARRQEQGHVHADESTEQYRERSGFYAHVESAEEMNLERQRYLERQENAREAGRIEGANSMWDQLPVPDRPLKTMKRRSKQVNKSLRFGAGRQVSFRIEPVEGSESGRGFGVAVEPVDTLDSGQAIRHVGAPDGWQATRQPGFGRKAAAPGEFPFSVRERLLNRLMQGQRLDPADLTALSGAFDSFDQGVYRGRMAPRTRAGRSTASLMDDLHGAYIAGVATEAHVAAVLEATARLDSRGLGRLLDLLDAGTTVV